MTAEPDGSRCPYPRCYDPEGEKSAVTDCYFVTSPEGGWESTLWGVPGYSGRLHFHNWHVYSPDQDTLPRHLGRAIIRRLPLRVNKVRYWLLTKWRNR